MRGSKAKRLRRYSRYSRIPVDDLKRKLRDLPPAVVGGLLNDMDDYNHNYRPPSLHDDKLTISPADGARQRLRKYGLI